jgi:hypothetical protein
MPTQKIKSNRRSTATRVLAPLSCPLSVSTLLTYLHVHTYESTPIDTMGAATATNRRYVKSGGNDSATPGSSTPNLTSASTSAATSNAVSPTSRALVGQDEKPKIVQDGQDADYDPMAVKKKTAVEEVDPAVSFICSGCCRPLKERRPVCTWKPMLMQAHKYLSPFCH